MGWVGPGGRPPGRATRGADDPDLLNDPFFVSLSTYLVESDTTVRFDGKTQATGTPIDWDRAFGAGSSNRFRLDGQWRFAERHKIAGS